MSDFLARAACKGRRPRGVMPLRHVQRPALIAQLLRERHVARFLTAPDGYGKTVLAGEYAQVVFAFSHVFWVNAGSPCFLRDLDAGVLASDALRCDEEPFLVVFEDVPRLDPVRADGFSRVVDALLERGEEVIVTCTPSADLYAARHRDRLRVAPDEMLVAEGDMREGTAGRTVPRAERAACVQWGTDGVDALLRGFAAEELPADVRLAAFVLLVLGSGGLDDADAFFPSGAAEQLRLLDAAYPFLGIDVRADRYCAMAASVETLAARFASSFEAMAACAPFDGGDALAMRLADALLAKREADRSCALMRRLASKAACAEWLLRRAADLMALACVKPAHDLHVFAVRASGQVRWSLNAADAWRLLLLQQLEEAVALARRVAQATAAPPSARRASCTLLRRCASDDEAARAERVERALDGAEAGAGSREHDEPCALPPDFLAAAASLADQPTDCASVALIAQRTAFRLDRAAERERKDAFAAAHPDPFRRDVPSSPRTPSRVEVPTLHVGLFGGVEARIGEAPVEARLMPRQKTRALLGMLVINRGKELSRDAIVSDLWPDSTLDLARRNFYSVWSQLKRALSTGPAALPHCPYLVRDQFGCRIDATLVDADVARFEDVCRALLFGGDDPSSWEHLYAEVTGPFARDLMPTETDSRFIVQMRDEYRTRLVDALVAASGRLVEAGEVRGALWLAREALKRDNAREDAYAAQMEAQVAGGQRSAALDTYFACRRFLADELGIDPSPRLVRLYRAIIEVEEDMEW